MGERRAGARARDASPPSFLERGRESWEALVNRKREREAYICDNLCRPAVCFHRAAGVNNALCVPHVAANNKGFSPDNRLTIPSLLALTLFTDTYA